LDEASRLHDEAMMESDEALWHLRKAGSLEAKAARLIPKDSEVIRAVLYRSAVTLKVEVNTLSEAETLIKEAREGCVPDEIEEELQQLEELIALYRKMKERNLMPWWGWLLMELGL